MTYPTFLKKTFSALAVAFSLTAVNAQAADFTIDPDHSLATFSVRHLANTVHGRFNTMKGEFSYDPKNLKTASGRFEIDAASIDTNSARRDKDLRSANFFEVEKYKTVVFVIKSAEQSGSALKVHGDLTIRDITKPVTFSGTYLGEITNPWGGKVTGFVVSSKINRKDYGLNWNKALEAGGFLVGDDVTIEINVEASPKPAEAAKPAAK